MSSPWSAVVGAKVLGVGEGVAKPVRQLAQSPETPVHTLYDGTPVSKLTLTHRERAMHTATAAAAVLLLCLAPSLALHGAVLHHRRLAVLAMCCELRLHSNGHVFRRGEVVLCGRRQRVP